MKVEFEKLHIVKDLEQRLVLALSFDPLTDLWKNENSPINYLVTALDLSDNKRYYLGEVNQELFSLKDRSHASRALDRVLFEPHLATKPHKESEKER